MNLKETNSTIGSLAAVATWGIVFGICLYWLPSAAPEIKAYSALIIFLFLFYIGCFLAIVRQLIPQDSKALFYGTVVAQLVSAFGLMLLLPINFLPILTIIWVSILPHVTTLKRSMMIMLAVVILWFVLYAIRWDEKNVWFTALLYSTFHLFAVFMNYETVKAEKASQEAIRLNKELQATQHLLSEASRQNERTRIARDLHDLLGHHLTALIINLQVASHLTDGEAKDKVEQCHSLAKLLLSDVREAVSTLRENQQLEFTKMLDLMCEQVPKLKIHRDIQTKISLEQMDIAKALLSCAQEAITNSLKHANATDFWISLIESDDNDNIELVLRDNGQASGAIKLGNGLKGMKERVQELSGDFAYTIENHSLVIKISLPKQASASTPTNKE